MTIRIPKRLTVDNSGKYIVSIRLRPDGLSFSGYVPGEPGSFFYREAVMDRAEAMADMVKEMFYAHDFLAWTFRRVRIVTQTTHYTLVPEALYEERRRMEFTRFVFSQAADCVLSASYAGRVALYAMDGGVYEFFSRSMVDPVFLPHVVPLLAFGEHESCAALPARMYVSLSEGVIDVVCFRQGGLLFANSFRVNGADDVLYYILYVWKQAALDRERDALFLHAADGLGARLTEMLAVYVRHVSAVSIPSEAYLLGEEIVRVPLDITALTVCEL